MSRILQCFILCFAGAFFLLTTGGPFGCSSGATPCKTRKDCSKGYSCLQSICQKSCAADFDCEDGKKCINSYCGGIQSGDSGAIADEGECSAGQTKPCFPKDKLGKGCSADGDDRYQCTKPCSAGTRKCESGSWGTCVGAVAATEEKCDGKDNDCDGKVDEDCGTTCKIGDTQPCYSADPKTKGVGTCKGGLQKCQRGQDGSPEWGQCENEVLPRSELCSTAGDDDCDGKANEGCKCKPGQREDCKATGGCTGQKVCKSASDGTTKWGECVAGKPKAEECNNLDDDCDGKVDNMKNSSKPIERKCLAVCFEGTEFCSRGNWKKCNAKLPKAESCNNIDDDCDGKVDNVAGKDDALIKGCPTGKKGLCENGQSFCKTGKWGSCIAPKPVKEDCNGLDDDCDGQVDEKSDKPCGDQECIKDTLGTKKCI